MKIMVVSDRELVVAEGQDVIGKTSSSDALALRSSLVLLSHTFEPENEYSWGHLVRLGHDQTGRKHPHNFISLGQFEQQHEWVHLLFEVVTKVERDRVVPIFKF